MRWENVATDPACGFSTVLACMAVEWPIFLLIALYLDQVCVHNTFLPSSLPESMYLLSFTDPRLSSFVLFTRCFSKVAFAR